MEGPKGELPAHREQRARDRSAYFAGLARLRKFYLEEQCETLEELKNLDYGTLTAEARKAFMARFEGHSDEYRREYFRRLARKRWGKPYPKPEQRRAS
jgi:hypothetical protein